VIKSHVLIGEELLLLRSFEFRGSGKKSSSFHDLVDRVLPGRRLEAATFKFKNTPKRTQRLILCSNVVKYLALAGTFLLKSNFPVVVIWLMKDGLRSLRKERRFPWAQYSTTTWSFPRKEPAENIQNSETKRKLREMDIFEPSRSSRVMAPRSPMMLG